MNGQLPSKSNPAPAHAEMQNSSQYVGFHLAGQEYAFRIEQIQEIVILKHVTVTPQVPDHVEGMSNLRGTMIPIINLRRLLGLERMPTSADTRTIVVNVGGRVMGCTVDSVSQVLRIHDEFIQPAPEAVTAGGGDHISGFARHEGRLVVLLEIDRLLDPDRMVNRPRSANGAVT